MRIKTAVKRGMLVAAFIGSGAPGRAVGQTDTMSASLARVLAETADIHDGRPHWIVAAPRFPHRISGVYSSREAARTALPAGEEFRIFGPFVTPIDFEKPYASVIAWCMHLKSPIASSYGPPYCPEKAFPADSIIAIDVIIRTRLDTLRMDVKNADALFFTASSIQKFVLPYYSRVYGPGYARALWDSVTARVGRLP